MTAPVNGPSLAGVMALRAEILERSKALAPLKSANVANVANAAGAPGVPGDSFAGTMKGALEAVNALQTEASAKAAAWERGEAHDIASVMLSRQKASLAFETTVQARNRLLSAYRDIMNMPV
jgi:flagellar hook-basal body complex protein FliE